MYRNPKIEALEYEVQKLQQELAAMKHFGHNIGSVYQDPPDTMILNEVDFFRVASMSVTRDDEKGDYHFIANIVTPPSKLTMSYYCTQRSLADRNSAYDILNYLTEDFMHKFYLELKKGKI